MSDPLRRALRTLLQMAASVCTAGGVLATAHLFGYEMSVENAAVLAAVLLPLVSWAQNELEDRGRMTPMLGTKFETGSSLPTQED